MKLNRI